MVMSEIFVSGKRKLWFHLVGVGNELCVGHGDLNFVLIQKL